MGNEENGGPPDEVRRPAASRERSMVMETKKASFPVAILTMVLVVAIMALGLGVFKFNTIAVFILALIAAAVVALCIGNNMEKVQEVILEGVKKSTLIVMIMVTVGMVVGSWIISGIVPSIIYYGLKLFTPATFLFVGFIICCLVSFFTGSSYAAMGTLGVAFMAIGYGMEVTPGLVAGMVVSGTIFGDKMSPFSDTTNMAPAAAQTDIFLHIKSMMYTTIPATVISAVLFLVLGFRYQGGGANPADIQILMDALKESFNINPLLLIVPVLTILLVVKKVPAMIALAVGSIMGVIVAFIAQDFTFKAVINSLAVGFSSEFEVEALARLLNRGGISSMLTTIIYCILALAFGELLYQMGVLDALLEKIKDRILKPRNLILATLFSCLATVIMTTSQYMAILLPGEVFQGPFKKAKVAPYVLSRTLEDGGTIFSFLVPWSAAAIYASGTLGVSTLTYLPYAFLPILVPIFAIICACLGIGVFDIQGNSLRGKTGKLVVLQEPETVTAEE